MKNILYISNEDHVVGGSSLSLLAMLQALKGEVHPTILFREDGPAADRFRGEGYECVVIPFRKVVFHSKGIKRVIRFIPHLITTALVRSRCVRKCKRLFKYIEAVHTNSSTVDIGLDIARALNVPHIWHIREYMDLGLHFQPFPSWKHWHRKLAASDCVIAISPGLFNHLHLERHRNAICLPDAVCSASDAVLIKEKEPYIAFLSGSICDIKRPDEAIRIFASAKTEGFRLKLTGNIDSEMKGRLDALAESLGVNDRIDYLPFTKDVKKLLSKASAVLVCTEFEGMGRVAIEAMFYGCPVIARNSGGSADVLENGPYGKLYNTVAEAAEKMNEVLHVFPLENVEAALNYAIKNFSIEDYRQKILNVYSRVCN